MKMLAMMLCALMLCAANPLSLAQTQDAETVATVSVEGLVMEAGEDYLILQGADGSLLQANLSAETILNVTAPIAVGDYVTVCHSGATTRSIPPQAAAISVVNAYASGVVSDMEENGFLLTQPDGTELAVHLPDGLPYHVQDGMTVTVYYNGMMTRSLPAQITAQYIRGHVLEGVIAEASEDELLLSTEMGEAVVHLSSETLVLVSTDVGTAVRVSTGGFATMSLPPQYLALEVLPGLAAEQ